MEPRLGELLQSSLAQDREEALQILSQKESNTTNDKRDDEGCSELLSTVARTDHLPSVRTAALRDERCPIETVLNAHFDRDVLVRKVALAIASTRCPGSEHASVWVKHMMGLLAVESDDDMIVRIIEALVTVLGDDDARQFVDDVSHALGDHRLLDLTFDLLFKHHESFRIIWDLAENDSPKIRRAVVNLLQAIFFSLAVSPSQSASQESRFIAKGCFSILEQLLGDANDAVNACALMALSSIRLSDSFEGLSSSLQLSEKSVKNLLRMADMTALRLGKHSPGKEVVQPFEIFQSYPCVSISAYGLVDTYFRRRTYAARRNVCRNKGSVEAVRKLLSTFQATAERNSHFARVHDLVKPPSDKVFHAS